MASWTTAFYFHRSAFIRNPENKIMYQYSEPSLSFISNFCVVHVSQREGSSTANAKTRGDPSFTLYEFSRLIAVLITNERIRHSLLRSPQVKNYTELDAGVDLYYFWVTLVKKELNDTNNTLSLHLSLVFQDSFVDASLPPLCYRSGIYLKDRFYST